MASALQDDYRPFLTALCRPDGTAIAPLRALRIQALEFSIETIAAFSGTLQHLVVDGLQWPCAPHLVAVLGRLTALKVLPPALFVPEALNALSG